MVAEEHGEKREERRRRHKSDQEKQPGRVALFLRRYWFEILAVVLFALGVFFVVERMQIKTSIVQTLKWLAKGVAGVVSSILAIERSDIVGTVLILVAIWMMSYSVRRIMLRRSPTLNSAEPCPKCGGHLGRSHSGRVERFLAVVMRVRIRHYSCRDCSFRASVWEKRSS